jgi:hypothetical protein
VGVLGGGGGGGVVLVNKYNKNIRKIIKSYYHLVSVSYFGIFVAACWWCEND